MKSGIRAIILLSLLLLVSVAAIARGFERHFDFYTDAAFTNWVGYRYEYCDDTEETGGTTADYRIITQYNCDLDLQSKACAHYENGVWVTVNCP